MQNKTTIKTKAKTAANDTTHKEGFAARMIEEETAKIPSDKFLWAALGSMGVSAALKLFKKDKSALFVGQWAAPFLLLGIYNKLVKQKGHEGEK